MTAAGTSAAASGDAVLTAPERRGGWVVVAGVFAMLAVSSGIGFYGLSVYLRALTGEGFSVGTVSTATAVFFVFSGLTGLPIGAWTSSRDVRPLVAAGAVASAVSLLLLGRLTSAWQLYAVYALFGAGFAASGLVPGTTLVARWFDRRRSVALSVASTGLSAGGVALTPVVATLIDRHGLRTVAPLLALAFVVLVVPVTALTLRPAPVAPHPDGGTPRPADGDAVADAVRTRFFAAVTGAHLLAMLAQVGGMAHLYNLVSERRGAPLAATALSVLAVSSLLGRLAGGALATRVPLRVLAVVLATVQGAALLLLAAAHSSAAVLLATVLFGVTVGNLLMLHPLLLAERFGVRDYARIYARSQLVATIGIAAGPAAAGLLRDALAGYGAAFGLLGAGSVAAGAVLLSSGPAARAVRPSPA